MGWDAGWRVEGDGGMLKEKKRESMAVIVFFVSDGVRRGFESVGVGENRLLFR